MDNLHRRLSALDRIDALGAAIGTGDPAPMLERLRADKDAAVERIFDNILLSARITGGKSAGEFKDSFERVLPSSDFVAISFALYRRAWDLWERLWVGKHPDRADEWETAEDFDLMPVWRDRLRGLFAKHHMASVLEMNPQAYMDKLTAEGLERDLALPLVEMFFDVHLEPDTAE